MNCLRNRYILLLIAFLCNFFAAQSKYFFYEVSTDSSKVYIFGSIHFGKAEWYPFESYIEDAFNNSDLLATEVDLNKVNQLSFLSSIFANDTIDLKYKLKPKNYKKALKNLKKLGLDESTIKRLRPWFVAFSLQRQELLQGEINAKDGVDLYFTKKANDKNKPIIGLEEVDFQFSLLEKFDCCADEIIEKVDEQEYTDEKITKITQAWLNGDDKTLDDLLNEIDGASEQYKNILHEILYKRNESFANSIESLLKDKKLCFVVVGAAHLIGKNSVIEYLKSNNRNYKITRIK